MRSVGAQHRQGKAELVVERPGGRDRGAGVGQHAGEHVLDRGLALRAGDCEDPRAVARLPQTPEHLPCELLQRGAGIGHEHRRHARGAGPEHGRCATLDRLGRVVVTVDVLPLERGEQPAAFRSPAVEERRAGDDDLGRARVHDATADDVGRPPRGVAGSREASPLCEGGPDLVAVVEGMHDAVDLLPGLVPLAGDDDRVARPRHRDSPPDRRTTVADLEHLGPRP